MSKLSIALAVIILGVWAGESACNTLDEDQKQGIRFGFGLGSSSFGGFSGIMHLSDIRDHTLLSLRRTDNVQDIWGDDIWDIGILYGPRFQSANYHVAFQAGIGIASGTRRPNWSTSRSITPAISLPLAINSSTRLQGRVALGLYVFASINSEESLAGAALCLQFGDND